MEVATDTGLGVMCPGCWKVETVADTGLALESTRELLFLRGWEPDVTVTLDGEEQVVSWLCGVCAEYGVPPREVALGRFGVE